METKKLEEKVNKLSLRLSLHEADLSWSDKTKQQQQRQQREERNGQNLWTKHDMKHSHVGSGRVVSSSAGKWHGEVTNVI